MVTVINSPKSFGSSFSGALSESLPDALGSLIERKRQASQLLEEDEALKRQGIDVKGIKNPRIREGLLDQKRKSGEAKDKLLANQSIISQLEKDRDLETGALSAYVNDPHMAEQISRPAKEPKKTQASQPIDPEQLKLIDEVRNTPGFDDLDEVGQYRALTRGKVSKENAEAESKLKGQQLERGQKATDNSFKAHEDFIKDTTKAYKSWETETKPKLMQLRNIKDEDLIGPTAAVFLEKLGIPLGALEDPSSELYNKVSLDLLKGLPETYGSRILKVEVDNFLKTIPSLMNSPDGRRMVASNMLKLGEMKETFYNEMRRQQKDSLEKNKPLPRDFEQSVFDQVKPRIDKINNEFVKLSEIKAVPPNTIPFFSPSGEVEFVPKEHAQWATENGGKRVW